MPGLLTAASPDDFTGAGTHVELCGLALSRLTLLPATYEQAPGMPDVLELVHVTSGTLIVSSPSGRRRFGPTGLVLVRPLRDDRIEFATEASVLWLTIPVAALRPSLLPQQDLPLLEVPRGITRPLSGLLNGVLDGLERGRPKTVRALHVAILAAAEAVLQEVRPAWADSGTVSLVVRAIEYVESEFTNPSLTPAVIAAALGVGVRTLHLAFEGEPRTVGRTVEARRLQGVEEALAAGSDATAAVLASRFGFSGADQLSRSYRRVRGESMTASRRRGGIAGPR